MISLSVRYTLITLLSTYFTCVHLQKWFFMLSSLTTEYIFYGEQNFYLIFFRLIYAEQPHLVFINLWLYLFNRYMFNCFLEELFFNFDEFFSQLSIYKRLSDPN